MGKFRKIAGAQLLLVLTLPHLSFGQSKPLLQISDTYVHIALLFLVPVLLAIVIATMYTLYLIHYTYRKVSYQISARQDGFHGSSTKPVILAKHWVYILLTIFLSVSATITFTIYNEVPADFSNEATLIPDEVFSQEYLQSRFQSNTYKADEYKPYSSDNTIISTANNQTEKKHLGPTIHDIKGDLAEKGRALFSGTAMLLEGGPACITCHHISDDLIKQGGTIAPDLTNVYHRLDSATIMMRITTSKYPAMQDIYGNNPITTEEALILEAYFKSIGTRSKQQELRDQRAASFLNRIKKKDP